MPESLSLVTVLSALKDLSVITALLVALWGGATRRWVWGHHYQEALTRELWWRDYATSLGDLTDKAVHLAERRKR
jgi:hypothetical protein